MKVNYSLEELYDECLDTKTVFNYFDKIGEKVYNDILNSIQVKESDDVKKSIKDSVGYMKRIVIMEHLKRVGSHG